jgi:RES domain-containing protein
MKLWCIYDHNAPYAKRPGFNPLDGQGGVFASARWHHAGTPVLYAAHHPSLAMLEVLVHIDSTQFGERSAIELDVPRKSIESLTLEHFFQAIQARQVPVLDQELVRDAPSGDTQRLTRNYGTQWLHENRSLLLEVPSLIMPFERNCLINPNHPEVKRIRLLRTERVRLDARLVRG